MIAVPQLTWEVHSLAEFTDYFHLTTMHEATSEIQSPTPKSWQHCDMRDYVPSGYVVLNPAACPRFLWPVKKSMERPHSGGAVYIITMTSVPSKIDHSGDQKH